MYHRYDCFNKPLTNFEKRMLISNKYIAKHSLAVYKYLQSLEWSWNCNPLQFPFLRLYAEGSNRKAYKVNANRMEPKSERLVGSGYDTELKCTSVLAVLKIRDIEYEGYACFDVFTHPYNKPIEGIDTKIIYGAITPEFYFEQLQRYEEFSKSLK